MTRDVEALLLQEELVDSGKEADQNDCGNSLLPAQKEIMKKTFGRSQRTTKSGIGGEYKGTQLQKTREEIEKLRIPLLRRLRLVFFAKKKPLSVFRFVQQNEIRLMILILSHSKSLR